MTFIGGIDFTLPPKEICDRILEVCFGDEIEMDEIHGGWMTWVRITPGDIYATKVYHHSTFRQVQSRVLDEFPEIQQLIVNRILELFLTIPDEIECLKNGYDEILDDYFSFEDGDFTGLILEKG